MSIKILYTQMMDKLKNLDPGNWQDVDRILTDFQQINPPQTSTTYNDLIQSSHKGLAFLTFDYGIDGVSIEIAKYAESLNDLLSENGKPDIHFIGGDFSHQADSILKPDWKRFHIQGANGWSKWDQGKWFAKLFYEDMSEDNQEPDELVAEIWKQAVSLSERLGNYLAENGITLLIPVNISSNPGNLALGLAVVLVSEAMGTYVLNSNHDFYWESGKPAFERKPGEAPGPRDHFFRNIYHQSFFSLFGRIYPWNGRRWIQVNINRLQSEKLIEEYSFLKDRVCEISTSLSDKFFHIYTSADVKSVRRRMAYILSDGQPIIHPIPIQQHYDNLNVWMSDQKPLVCGAREGLNLDLSSNQLIYYLQPTRVISRKRIEKDCQLIGSLLHYPAFREEFEKDTQRQIVLHITGPVPIEHQADLETVIRAFIDVINSVPPAIAERLFLAFSVGTENHPSFAENGFDPLCIEDIYRLADAVLFPSETEGRGLPIGEASASEIPIICSCYFPEEVFADAVGEDLTAEKQIQYTLFPEEEMSDTFLDEVTRVSLFPEKIKDRIAHNRNAAHLRYGKEIMGEIFKKILTELFNNK